MIKEYNLDVTEEKPLKVEAPAMTYEVKPTQAFSNYQKQILDSIANVQDEEEMRDICNLIADYFSNKALDAIDRLCEDGSLSTEAIESWNKEHMHTPYIY